MAYDPISMAFPNIQADMMRGQRDMQMADMFANSGYVQNSGPWGVLAQMAQAWAGGKLAKRGEERIADALRRQFEEDTKAREREEEKAAKAEEAAYQRDLGRRRGEAADPLLNPQKAQKKFVNGFWVDPTTGSVEQVPEYLAAQERVRAAGRTNVNVSAGGATPPTEFQKALDKKDAEYFGALRDAATTAAQTLDQVKVIEDVLTTAETGKVPQALAMAGQYFGTEAGADMQKFQAASNRMVLDLAQKMKGALSDSDRRMLEQAAPSFGLDPRANQVILGLIKKGASNAQSTYQAADQYASQKGGLRGFVPPQAVNLTPPTVGQYQIGQIIDLNGKKYRVTGGSPDDPDVEEVK